MTETESYKEIDKQTISVKSTLFYLCFLKEYYIVFLQQIFK